MGYRGYEAYAFCGYPRVLDVSIFGMLLEHAYDVLSPYN